MNSENDIVLIDDDAILYRRFHRANIRRDGRITYAAYIRRKPPPSVPDPEISVDLANLTTPEKALEGNRPDLYGEFGLGMLKVRDIRELGFKVRHDPVQGNFAHCIIEGVKTETDCQILAEKTSVHTPPPSRKSSK